MSAINLLPDSFRLKASTVKTAGVLKKISILLFSLLLISIITIISLFILNNKKFKEVKVSEETIRKQIKALEETEQRLILVQDRIKKIDKIAKITSSSEEIEGLTILVDGLNSSIQLTDVKSDDQKLSLNVVSTDTTSTFDLLDYIRDSGEFKGATVNSMEFNPKTGFSSELVLVTK